jgi:hypothetical protein
LFIEKSHDDGISRDKEGKNEKESPTDYKPVKRIPYLPLHKNLAPYHISSRGKASVVG